MTKIYTQDELINLPHRGKHDYHNKLSDILRPLLPEKQISPYWGGFTGHYDALRMIELELTPEQQTTYINHICELLDTVCFYDNPNGDDIDDGLFKIRTASEKDIAIALILTLQPKEGE